MRLQPSAAVLERRANARQPVCLGAVIASGTVETLASTIDLSKDGVLLRSIWSWPPGTRLTVRLLLEDGTCVAAHGEVRRCAADGMAVRVGVSSPAFKRLAAALEGALAA